MKTQVFYLIKSICLMMVLSMDFATAQVAPYCAVPVDPEPKQMIQADDTNITIKMYGDGILNYMETDDGFTVLKDEDGFFKYVLRDESTGGFLLSNIKAHDIGNRTAEELTFLSSNPHRHLRFTHQALAGVMEVINDPSRSNPPDPIFPPTGVRKALLLLIDFPDLSQSNSPDDIDDMCNQAGYNHNGQHGSFKDYYEDISYGALTVNTDVTEWFRANNNRGSYGYNSGFLAAVNLVREAVDQAEQSGVLFSEYDNDNDGQVDVVMVIHAGRGREESGDGNDIWSHRWVLAAGGQSVTYDGVLINDYIIQPETYSNANTRANIGVLCHEFGHALGLPDLYDTNGGSEGLGRWGLMGSGSWNDGGRTPAHMCAWSKTQLGWMNPTVLSGSDAISNMNHVDAEATCYRINTPDNTEYFLIENRQQEGWDSFLPGEGLAIWHIDTDRTNLYPGSNTVNASDFQHGVGLEQADGNSNLNNGNNRGDSGDLYPGSSNNTTFNDTSNPNSKTYNNANSNVCVHSINQSGNNISFSYGCGNPPTACTTDAYEPNNSSSAAQYIGNSTYYNLDDLCLTTSDNDYFRFMVDGTNYYVRVSGSGGATGSYRLSYNRTASGIMTIETHAVDGSTTNTSLNLYSSDGFTQLEADDNSGVGNFSRIIYTIPSTENLTVSPSVRNVEATAGSTTFSITSNQSWSASDNASWLTVSPTSGSNNGTLTANYTANTGTTSRTGTITISGGGITRMVTVVQAGSSSFLTVTPASHSVSSNAGAATFNISSNVSWTASDNVNWLSISQTSGSNNATINANYMANQLSASRTGTITISGGGITRTVTVVQAGVSAELSVSPASRSVSNSSGSVTFNVTSNINWTASDNSSWLTVSPTSGMNNAVITANYTANTSTSSRTGTITIVGSGITRTVTVVQAGASSGSCTSDNYEPNNSTSAAATVASNVTLNNLCLTSNDQDYFRFMVNGENYYARVRGYSSSSVGQYSFVITSSENSITLETMAYNNSTTDTYIYLYNSMGTTILAQDDDAGEGYFSYINYTIPATPSLSITPANQSVNYPSGSATFTVASNVSWTASDNTNWLTINPMSGSNNGTISASFTSNTSTSSRTATITVTGGGMTATATVTQEGMTQTQCTSDAYESNNTVSTAATVGANATLNNLCLTTGDNDYFKFYTNGQYYYVRVRGYNSTTTVGQYKLMISSSSTGITLETMPYNNSTTDTYIYLYDANGTSLLAQDDDAGIDYFSKIEYEFPICTLTVNPSNQEVGNTNGTTNFTVTSNTSWTASDNASWLSITPSSGSNNGTIYASFTTNGTANPRTATITISGCGITRIVTVTQAGTSSSGCSTDSYEPNNTASQAYLANSGSTFTQLVGACISVGDYDYYKFTYNNQYYYAMVRGYNTATTTGQYTINFLTNNNTIEIETEAYNGSTTDTYLYLYDSNGTTILASDDDSGSGYFSKLMYTLPGTTSLSVSPTTRNVSSSPGSVTFAVNSNASWTASDNASWLTLSPNSGSGNANFYANYTANTSTSSRTATITVSAGDQTRMVYVIQEGNSSTASCTSDVYEPNDLFAQASYIGSGAVYSLNNLCLTPDDKDHFKFYIDGDAYTVKVRGYNSTSAGEYRLTYNLSGNVLTIQTHPVNGSTTDTYLLLYNNNAGALLDEDDDGGTGYFSRIQYTLPNASYLSVTPSMQAVNSAAGSTSFSVSSNITWTISESVDWLSVNPTTSTGNMVFNVGYSANNTAITRTGTITISGDGLNETVTVQQAGAAGVTNDDPCNATQLYTSNACNFVYGSNIGASNTSPSPYNPCYYSGGDVWFKFTASTTSYTIQGSSYTMNDGMMGLYTGSCSGLSYIECDDDDGVGLMPKISRNDFVIGQTYYVRFWGYSGQTGSFGVCVQTGLNFTSDETEDVSAMSTEEIEVTTIDTDETSDETTKFDLSQDKINETSNSIQLPLTITVFPNPTTVSTTIAYDVTEATNVTIDIYDPQGRKQISVVKRQQEAGSYQEVVDLSRLSHGMYLVRCTVGDQMTSKRLVVTD